MGTAIHFLTRSNLLRRTIIHISTIPQRLEFDMPGARHMQKDRNSEKDLRSKKIKALKLESWRHIDNSSPTGSTALCIMSTSSTSPCEPGPSAEVEGSEPTQDRSEPSPGEEVKNASERDTSASLGNNPPVPSYPAPPEFEPPSSRPLTRTFSNYALWWLRPTFRESPVHPRQLISDLVPESAKSRQHPRQKMKQQVLLTPQTAIPGRIVYMLNLKYDSIVWQLCPTIRTGAEGHPAVILSLGLEDNSSEQVAQVLPITSWGGVTKEQKWNLGKGVEYRSQYYLIDHGVASSEGSPDSLCLCDGKWMRTRSYISIREDAYPIEFDRLALYTDPDRTDTDFFLTDDSLRRLKMAYSTAREYRMSLPRPNAESA